MATSADVITVVSTRTVDRFPDGRGVSGGPATYTIEALRRLDVPHRLVTGEVAHVAVLPGPDGEQYSIPALPLIPMPPILEGSAVILSPIMREIDPEAVPPVSGLLALDMQGFVRQPSGNAVTGESAGLAALLARAAVVKASEEELSTLSHESQAAAQGSTLLLTRGARGAVIRRDGEDRVIAARPVAASHTIGAGDTFLAAFLVALLEGDDPGVAGARAARFTESLLLERVV